MAGRVQGGLGREVEAAGNEAGGVALGVGERNGHLRVPEAQLAHPLARQQSPLLRVAACSTHHPHSPTPNSEFQDSVQAHGRTQLYVWVGTFVGIIMGAGVLSFVVCYSLDEQSHVELGRNTSNWLKMKYKHTPESCNPEQFKSIFQTH